MKGHNFRIRTRTWTCLKEQSRNISMVRKNLVTEETSSNSKLKAFICRHLYIYDKRSNFGEKKAGEREALLHNKNIWDRLKILWFSLFFSPNQCIWRKKVIHPCKSRISPVTALFGLHLLDYPCTYHWILRKRGCEKGNVYMSREKYVIASNFSIFGNQLIGSSLFREMYS